MRFEQPFYISYHAVWRFRQRIAMIPREAVRSVIQASLQPGCRLLVGIAQSRDQGEMPVYSGVFQTHEFYVPVIWKRKGWPAVATILRPGMAIRWVK